MALASRNHTHPSTNEQPLPPLPPQVNGPQLPRRLQLWHARGLSGLQWGSSSAQFCSEELKKAADYCWMESTGLAWLQKLTWASQTLHFQMSSCLHPWCGILWGSSSPVDLAPPGIFLHKHRWLKTIKKQIYNNMFFCSWYRSWHTSKLPECQLHFGLVGGAATHVLRFHLHILHLQKKYFFLQWLLEPRAPLLIWTQIGDGEAHCNAQHRGANCQWYMTVGGCMGVIKENLCKGFVLWNLFRKTEIYELSCKNTLKYTYTISISLLNLRSNFQVGIWAEE